MWGVGLASEGKMRKEASELVGDNLDAELVPFSFKHKDGGQIIKSAPYCYIPRLWDKIQELIEQNSDDHRGYVLVIKATLTCTCTFQLEYIELPGTKELYQRLKSG